MRFYLGKTNEGLELFKSSSLPTPETGYAFVIGPFKTKRGAIFMKNHSSVHTQCVNDAEYFGKYYKKHYDGEKFNFSE
jgi:hypothetical protein